MSIHNIYYVEFTEAMEMALNSKTKARKEVDEMKKNPALQQVLSTKESQGDQNGGDSEVHNFYFYLVPELTV